MPLQEDTREILRGPQLRNYRTADAAVCIVDALGVKGVYRRMDPRRYLELWAKGVKIMEAAVAFANAQQLGDARVFALSDTIVVRMIANDARDAVVKLSKVVSPSMGLGLAFGGVPLRGCISAGTIYESQEAIIGPAVDEAAMSYMRTNWIGVHLTESAVRTLEYPKQPSPGWLVRYRVPFKLFPRKAWALNWPGDIKLEGKPSAREIIVTRFNETGRVPYQVRVKQRNTLRFFDEFYMGP